MNEGMSGRRGQLLLIAGLGIAMTLVVLAIVLNTVIFTQNLATREAIDTRSPVEFTNAVDEGIGGAMTVSNFWNASGYAALDDAFRRSVSTWAGNATLFSASKGMATDVSLHHTTNGTRIVQPANGTWTSASDSGSWTMATGVEDTRRFHANVSRAGLATNDGTNLGPSDAFRINVSDGSNTWSLYVYRNTSDANQIDATAIDPTGTATTCSADAAFVELDATDATLNGTDCGFTFAAGVSSPYSISVEHGTSTGARYTLVVDREQSGLLGALPTNTYHDQATGESPFTAPAIYSARMNVTVDRADVTYTRNFTITPDSVPGGETYHVASSASGRELVYVDAGSGELSSIDKWGTVTTYNASNPEAISPKQTDLDGDGALEIAFVDGTNSLFLIDATDSTPSLTVGNVKHTNSVLAVGTWNGETGVSYVNTTDGAIYHVNTSSLTRTQVQTGGSATQANAVVAVTDYNGDGDTDIVYTDTSDVLHYVDGGTAHSVGVTLATTPGVGGGAGRDFAREGSRRVPFVSTGQDVVLVDSSGVTETLVTGGAVETSVAGFDVTGDERLEGVYVNQSTGAISYVTLDGATGDVTTGGASITANQTVGVA